MNTLAIVKFSTQKCNNLTERGITLIMVLIFTVMLAIFFLGIDGLFRTAVNWLLTLAG